MNFDQVEIPNRPCPSKHNPVVHFERSASEVETCPNDEVRRESPKKEVALSASLFSGSVSDPQEIPA